LEEFRNLGIDFVSFSENIDTSSPLGSAIFTIISAVAQLERDIIAERVRAGLRRARERGKQLGRPKTHIALDDVLKLRSQGLSHRAIARKLGVAHSTIGQILRVDEKPCRNEERKTA
jgi:DNA invertase Pin-like site-specific DNA recombinase